MPKVYKIRKGFDINLAGKAEKFFGKLNPSEFYAVKPVDFHGLVPKLVVKEGVEVKAGSALFTDKNRPDIYFTSPVSGKVVAINRGERRAIQEVVVRNDGEMSYESFTTADPLGLSRDEVIAILLKSGLWPAIKQRPYNIIANPEDHPKAVFIPAFDKSPLAPDYDFVVQGAEADFQVGVNALSRITQGRVYINVNDEYPPSHAFTQARNVQVNYFRGPHPSGNVSVHIQRIAPLNKGEVIWVVYPQEVIAIGRLFTKGVYDASRLIALTGSEVHHPRYYRVIGGTSVKSLVDGNVTDSGHLRYISGNPLTGPRVSYEGFIGYYDSQVTVIPEGRYFEFLGWALPGFKKYSFSRSFWSWLVPDHPYKLDTNLHGGHRAFVMTGLYEKVFPLDIYPMQLLKAILAEDVDQMERLGIYEVAEEDFALCEFICPSKTEMQSLVRKGLDLMKQEMS
jgi:Na+-transporting NADH:ubiquinone oxidoreductase subunit A